CYCLFFFSSRRRHTRSKRDWSSDVCSSDLFLCAINSKANLCNCFFSTSAAAIDILIYLEGSTKIPLYDKCSTPIVFHQCFEYIRSEERRVGKECRYRWSLLYLKSSSLLWTV